MSWQLDTSHKQKATSEYQLTLKILLATLNYNTFILSQSWVQKIEIYMLACVMAKISLNLFLAFLWNIIKSCIWLWISIRRWWVLFHSTNSHFVSNPVANHKHLSKDFSNFWLLQGRRWLHIFKKNFMTADSPIIVISCTSKAGISLRSCGARKRHSGNLTKAAVATSAA